MFKPAPYKVKVLSDSSPKKLAKKTEKQAGQMANDGYVIDNMSDENVGFLGVTTHQIRTITYRYVGK